MSIKEYIASGSVENGQLHIHGKRKLEAELRRWRDCRVIITIAKAYATRSGQQNAWYWSQILRLLSGHTGHTELEIHEYLKRRYNPKPICIVNSQGEIVDEDVIGESTTKLNRLTFADYCEHIRSFSSDLGLWIPDPDPLWREHQAEELEA